MPKEEQQAQDTGTATGEKPAGNEQQPQEQAQQQGTEGRTFTQAEVNSFVAEEKRKIREQLKAEAEKKQAEEQGNWKKLYEQAQETIQGLEAKVAELELNQVKSRVASKHKLSEAQAARLRGSNEAELEQDAKDLVKAFGLDRGQGSGTGQVLGTPEGSKESRGAPDRVEEQYKALQADPLYSM